LDEKVLAECYRMGVLNINKTLIIVFVLTIGVLSGCGTASNVSELTTNQKTSQTASNTSKGTTNQTSLNKETANQATNSETPNDTSSPKTNGNVKGELILFLQPGPCCPILSEAELEKIVGELPGITKATAGTNGQMTISYEASKTSLREIQIQILQKVGYYAKIDK
jgi:hypothetical protein